MFRARGYFKEVVYIHALINELEKKNASVISSASAILEILLITLVRNYAISPFNDAHIAKNLITLQSYFYLPR